MAGFYMKRNIELRLVNSEHDFYGNIPTQNKQ